jgi:hypothetical protein
MIQKKCASLGNAVLKCKQDFPAARARAAFCDQRLLSFGKTLALVPKPEYRCACGDWQQPAEDRYRLSRAMLEAVREYSFPLFLVERSPLLLRDSDLLLDIKQRSWLGVVISFRKTFAQNLRIRAAASAARAFGPIAKPRGPLTSRARALPNYSPQKAKPACKLCPQSAKALRATLRDG